MRFYLNDRIGEDGKQAIVIRGRDSFGKQYRIFLTSKFKEARIAAKDWKSTKNLNVRQKVKGNPTLGYTLEGIETNLKNEVMKKQVLNPAYNIPDAWKDLYFPKTEHQKESFPEKVLDAIPFYKVYYQKTKSHGYLRILDQVAADINGWNKDIVFSKLNKLTLDSFKSYLTGADGKRISEKRLNKKKKIVTLKPLESATVYGRFKFLRELATLARNHGVLVDPYVFDFKIKYEHHGGGFALTFPELLKVYHYKSENKTRMIARDYFLLEAFTGIRNSDCQDLRNGSIHPEYIQYFDQKNGSKSKTVTRHKLNNAIIKKYYDPNRPDDFLLPRLAQGTVNAELKFIARELKLDRLIPHNRQREPIYRHLSTHDGRHSYATLLNRQGVPQDYVKEELGHSQGGITHQVYVHREDRYEVISEAMNGLPTDPQPEGVVRKLKKAV